MSDSEFVVTKEGYLQLKEEHEGLVRGRPQIAQKIKVTREQGDLSENAAYKAAREEQSFIERRILELEEILKQAEVVEHVGSCEEIGIGCRVKIQSDGRMQEFQIVGALEADPKKSKISSASPLGKRLIGKKVGDELTIKTPSGNLVYTVEGFS